MRGGRRVVGYKFSQRQVSGDQNCYLTKVSKSANIG
jgi:hypothetical protein